MPGAFVHKCKPDGSYEEKQCHGSTGHCWCVESASGVEIKGTRKGPGKGKVTCGVGIPRPKPIGIPRPGPITTLPISM